MVTAVYKHLNRGGRSLGTVSRSRYQGEKTGRSKHFCPEIALGDTLLDPAVIESKEQSCSLSKCAR